MGINIDIHNGLMIQYHSQLLIPKNRKIAKTAIKVKLNQIFGAITLNFIGRSLFLDF